MPKGFDSKCLELAEHFIDEESPSARPRLADLAQTIQDAVEMWFVGQYGDPPQGTLASVTPQAVHNPKVLEAESDMERDRR